MSQSVLVVEHPHGSTDRHAQVWTLNRPQARNALDPELVAALGRALEHAQSSGVRVVVIRGAGKSFCAGADLRHLASYDERNGDTPRRLLADIWDLTLDMERSDIVFVAALHGHAVAGGLELALACDVVVAEEGTLIGDGHVVNNLVPGGGASARMERALGKSTALWLALSGALLDARDPRLCTWLGEVVPQGSAGAAAMQAAGQVLRVPDEARRRYKHLIHAAGGAPDAADKSRELDAFDQHWADQDVPHALQHFLARNREISS